ncbi:uracil-DNA glycosylase [Azonexus sp. IMCC34839]|uniref:uracil-DNA glycosylase n=1 Tax=Azonexus sp. IMCC34839 TaxID=3133695 RepID=UPI00399B1569
MSLSREQMLVEMGISPLWVLRDKAVAEPAGPDVEENTAAPPVADVRQTVAPTIQAPMPIAAVDGANWPELARQVAECKACGLCQQRKQAVLGVGDLNPDWLFIGEGPGAEEDLKGEPFVGQAGKLLDNMLAALDIARGNKVYIANAVKCRPPGNRTPEASEMAACRPYLERQIALLKPKVIVLLGKAAVHTILHDDKSLSALRGQPFEYAGIPVVVTYHPAYLLRNLPEKAKAWEDLLLARKVLRQQAAPELPL